jgi:hypothetical protein
MNNLSNEPCLLVRVCFMQDSPLCEVEYAREGGRAKTAIKAMLRSALLANAQKDTGDLRWAICACVHWNQPTSNMLPAQEGS